MTTVIGVFDNDVKLEKALNKLDRINVGSTRLLRDIPNSTLTDSFLDPILVRQPQDDNSAPDSVEYATFDEMGDFDLSEEQKEFYAEVAQGHGNIIFIEADKKFAEVVGALESSNASRVDTID